MCGHLSHPATATKNSFRSLQHDRNASGIIFFFPIFFMIDLHVESHLCSIKRDAVRYAYKMLCEGEEKNNNNLKSQRCKTQWGVFPIKAAYPDWITLYNCSVLALFFSIYARRVSLRFSVLVSFFLFCYPTDVTHVQGCSNSTENRSTPRPIPAISWLCRAESTTRKANVSGKKMAKWVSFASCLNIFCSFFGIQSFFSISKKKKKWI